MINMRLNRGIKLMSYGALMMVIGVAIGVGITPKPTQEIYVNVTSELAIDPYIERMTEITPDPKTGFVDYNLTDMAKNRTVKELEAELLEYGYAERPYEAFVGIPQKYYTYEKTLRFDKLCQTFRLLIPTAEAEKAFEDGNRNFRMSKDQNVSKIVGFIDQVGCFS